MMKGNISTSLFFLFFNFKEKVDTKVAAVKFCISLLDEIETGLVPYPDHDQAAAQTLREQVEAGIFDLDKEKIKLMDLFKHNVLKIPRVMAKTAGDSHI